MKRVKTKNNLLLYLLKMLLIFISINLLLMILSTLISDFAFNYKYGNDLVIEIYYALFVLIVMILFKNYYVFTDKKEKFLKSIKYGASIIILSIITLIINISSLNEFVLSKFINVLIYCIFIGIAEEFLCRGWLQNEFIERFSSNKKMVITSIMLSSLVFGFMHILNIGNQTLFETILQIINATSLGFLLGVIYYKTKNIWSVIFLHAFWDFSIMIGEMNYIKDCTYNSPSTAIIIVNSINIIFFCFLWIFSAISVIQKSDFPNEKSSTNKTSLYVKLVIYASFIMVFVPFDNLVYDYDNYRVCYNYDKKSIEEEYMIYYPHYKEYIIKNDVESIYYENNDNNMQEVLNIDNYELKFYIKNEKVYLENVNTGYKVTFDYKDIKNIELIDNDGNYSLLIHTLENESTIYYCNIIDNNLSNKDEYIDIIKSSFKKYELPTISSVGYISFKNNNYKYPIMVSEYNNYFIIENGKLYLIN